MRIAYRLTEDDLFAFQWRAARRRRPGRRRFGREDYVLWGVLLSLLLILAWIDLGIIRYFASTVLPGLAVFAVVFTIVTRTMNYYSLRRTIRTMIGEETPDNGSLGKHEVVLTESNISDVTPAAESRTLWRAVDRVEQDDEYIFIYTSANAATVVPKRAFADSDAAITFLAAAHRYRAAAANRCR